MGQSIEGNYTSRVVAAAESDGGISRAEYTQLRAEFLSFAGSKQSDISAWLADSHPRLSGLLNSATFDDYQGPRTMRYDSITSSDPEVVARMEVYLRAMEEADLKLDLTQDNALPVGEEEIEAIFDAIGGENWVDFVENALLGDVGLRIRAANVGTFDAVARGLGRRPSIEAENLLVEFISIKPDWGPRLRSIYDSPVRMSMTAEDLGALLVGGKNVEFTRWNYEPLRQDLFRLAQEDPAKAAEVVRVVDAADRVGRIDAANAGFFGAERLAVPQLINEALPVLREALGDEAQLPEERGSPGGVRGS